MKKWVPLLVFQILFLATTFMITLIHVEHIYDGNLRNSSSQNTISTNTFEKSDLETQADVYPQNKNISDSDVYATEQDLTVQDRVADAAEEANRLTKHQNWIGIIGLGLVALTTLFAWGAWMASAKAVVEAKKQLAFSIKGQQPTLMIEKIEWELVVGDERATKCVAEGKCQFRPLIFVKNIGSRPIYRVYQRTEFELKERNNGWGNSTTTTITKREVRPAHMNHCHFSSGAVGMIDKLEAGGRGVLSGLHSFIPDIDPISEFGDGMTFQTIIKFRDDFAGLLKGKERSLSTFGFCNRDTGDSPNTTWYLGNDDQYEYDRNIEPMDLTG